MKLMRCERPGALEPMGIEQNGLGLFRIAVPCIWSIGGQTIVIPQGFVTDGASIPFWARWALCAWGRSGTPAILHDYLLSREDVSKFMADWAFYGALKANNVSGAVAFIMFLAVRTHPKSRRMRRQKAISLAVVKTSPRKAPAAPAVAPAAAPRVSLKPKLHRPTLAQRLKALIAKAARRIETWATA